MDQMWGLGIVVLWLVGVLLQTLGNPLLRQAELQLRPWANTALSLWSGSGLVIIMVIVLLKGATTQKNVSREEACGMLILIGFLTMIVFWGAVCIAMTSKVEWVGVWNGQQVVMVTDDFSGVSYYQYHGSVLMGEYLGDSFDD